MKSNELRMTASDIDKLSYLNTKADILFFIFLIFGVLSNYLTWDRNNLLLKIFLGVFSFIGILGLYKSFFGKKRKKDFSKKIKVVHNTKIIDKTIEDSGSVDGFATKCVLIFENSKKYTVSNYIFKKVEIGDEIKIEYAKYSKLIFRITSKSLNIEYSNSIQSF